MAGFEPARGNPSGFLVHRLNHFGQNGAKGTDRVGERREKEGGKGGKREREKEGLIHTPIPIKLLYSNTIQSFHSLLTFLHKTCLLFIEIIN